MMRLVLDASALVAYLLGVRSDRVLTSAVSIRNDLHVPAICDVEVVSAVSREVRRGTLADADAQMALLDYVSLPIGRHLHTRAIGRGYELRDNFTAADASYVALAEALGADLVTLDEALARAVRRHTGVRVVP